MKVTTGFGYFVENGLKISKYVLPIGEHKSVREGVSFVEVESEEALNAVVLDKTPLSNAEKKRNITGQLNELDSKTIRALRTNDSQRLLDLENQAISLRQQLASLG